jgi:gliding motility-associated-like protein
VKIFLYTCLGVFCFGTSHAQGLLNKGAQIVIKGGATIQVDGKDGNFTNDSLSAFDGKVKITDTGSVLVRGNWVNNARNTVFSTDKGAVVLNGDTQAIRGLQPTGFYHLILQGTGIKILEQNANVGGEFANPNGKLNLGSLPLALNSHTLLIHNPNPTAISKSSGYIVSESNSLIGYGYLRWQIGNGAKGNIYEFPFGTKTGQSVPFIYSITLDGFATDKTASIRVATYPTDPAANPNNRPLPLGVNNLDNEFGVDNSPNVADRYWVVHTDKFSIVPKADITFTYADEEWNTANGSTNEITEPELLASRYDSTTKKWVLPPFGINNNAQNTVTVKGTYQYPGNWTLANKTVCPLANAQIPDIGCLFDSVQLTDVSTIIKGKIVKWAWDFGDGNKSTLQNPKHAWITPGTFKVTLRVFSNFGCSDTFQKTINFFPLPAADFITVFPYCIYDTIQFTDKSNGKSVTLKSWEWDFGDGNTSTLKNPKHKFSLPGKYTVKLIVTNQYDCRDTVEHELEIYPQPVADFTVQPSACQEDVVPFTDKSTIPAGSIKAWAWDFGDGIGSKEHNPSHRFKGAGTFQISLIVTSSFGCTDTFSSSILIHAKPVASFVANPDSTTILTPTITFTNQSLNYTEWNWDFGDQETSSEKDPVHTYTDTGTYFVTLYTENANGCKDTAIGRVIIAPDFRLWMPNAFTPNNNRINEVFKPEGIFYNTSKYEFRIYDRWGQLIFESHDLNEGWNGQFRNKGPLVEDGVYVYRIIIRDHLQNYHKYNGNVTVFR